MNEQITPQFIQDREQLVRRQRNEGAPQFSDGQQRQRVAGALAALVVSVEGLAEHCAALRRQYAGRLPYRDGLSPGELDAVLQRGLDALDPKALARLVLNPVALCQLAGEIAEQLPDAWWGVLDAEGRRLWPAPGGKIVFPPAGAEQNNPAARGTAAAFGDSPDPGSVPVFHTTRRTLVEKAKGMAATPQESLEARRLLWEIYAGPVFCYVHNWLPRERRAREAADLAQDFLIKFFWGEQGKDPGLRNYDYTRGKLRSYIGTAVDNFLITHVRRRNADIRRPLELAVSVEGLEREGGNLPPVSGLTVEEVRERYGNEVADALSPKEAFIRCCALEYGYRAVERACRLQSPEMQPTVKLILENLWKTNKPDYARVAEQLGTTVGAVKQAFHRFRNDLIREVRQLVESNCSEDQSDSELKFILRQLGVHRKPV
jgi:hypothetical protein